MKKIFTDILFSSFVKFLFIFAAIGSNLISYSADNITYIKYENEGSDTVKINYDAYYKGEKSKVVMNVKAIEKDKSVTIEAYSDGKTVYVVANAKGIIVGMKMNTEKFAKEFETGNQFFPIKLMNGCDNCEKIGEEKIAGKKCIIYKDKTGIQYSLYDGKYPLKTVLPEYTIIAKKFNADVSEDIFNAPNDIQYMNFDE